jgi:hypothetical protein
VLHFGVWCGSTLQTHRADRRRCEQPGRWVQHDEGVTQTNPTPDVKAYLPAADGIVDQLTWQLGETEAQRKRSRGRVAALAHHVAGLLAIGWTEQEIRTALATAADAPSAPDAGAQEKRWRTALKRARHERREQERARDTA